MRRTALLILLLALPGLALAQPALLFRNATLVTMTEAGLLPGRDLLISDGRIRAIGAAGSIEAPEGATVVDASGQFLMPGLAEMHAHVPGPEPAGYADEVLLLFAAHGVTTIRGMLGHPAHLALRERILREELLAPRLFTSGPSLNGNSAPDPQTARALVRAQKVAGYDFLKLHPGLSRPVFDAIVATAREVRIPFAGHVSDDVGVPHALAAGQSAIDHLDGYLHALAEPRCLDGSIAPGFFGIGLADCADSARIPALVEATRLAGTWMAPTQVLIEQWALPPSEAELRKRPALRYLRPAVVEQWLQARSRFLGLQGLPAGHAARYIEIRRELLRQMHAAGVPILLASDAPQVFNVPGDSTLAELELYGEIGLTPLEALATGTALPASFFGQGREFGSIREGMAADLVLLEGNPAEDLGNLRRQSGVVLRGRWWPREALDARLRELARRNAR